MGRTSDIKIINELRKKIRSVSNFPPIHIGAGFTTESILMPNRKINTIAIRVCSAMESTLRTIWA